MTALIFFENMLYTYIFFSLFTKDIFNLMLQSYDAYFIYNFHYQPVKQLCRKTLKAINKMKYYIFISKAK